MVVDAAPTAHKAILSGIPSVLLCMAYMLDRQGESTTHRALLQIVLAPYAPAAGRPAKEAGKLAQAQAPGVGGGVLHADPGSLHGLGRCHVVDVHSAEDLAPEE